MIEQEPGIVELVDTRDSRAVRNKNNVLGFYDLVINKKRSEESVAQFMAAASRSPKLKLDRWCCSLTLREPRSDCSGTRDPAPGIGFWPGGMCSTVTRQGAEAESTRRRIDQCALTLARTESGDRGAYATRRSYR